ncbi:hypothetical protein IEQ34_018132 [Dendrobium chrysotoxum]|uniref:Uncharacterized protein n=1 Tax=Dendrobium chrysotoxum TaxID=161865 RepID=A0AAV7GDJ4_DENCH|nr:hypothetical protein IEQ34_018132 [Dendrobium chrysotoxum]
MLFFAADEPSFSLLGCEKSWPKPETEAGLTVLRRLQKGTLSTGVTMRLADRDRTIPRGRDLGSPLKMLGLLELLSSPWKITFPDALSRGLSIEGLSREGRSSDSDE